MTKQFTLKSMFRWIVPVIAVLVLATVLVLAIPVFGYSAAQPSSNHSHAGVPAPESSPRAGGGCNHC